MSSNNMLIEFIAHAGICVKTENITILIDPWFTDSTVQQPLIKEIIGYPTIDFQIPKTLKRPSEYEPDMILLSHFHAHHAPLNDILELIGSKNMSILHPYIETVNDKVREVFKVFPQVTTKSMQGGDEHTLEGTRVTAMNHTVAGHVAWSIVSPTGSVLHIADPSFNENHSLRKIGGAWSKFKDLKPDVLFINTGGNSLRRETKNGRSIVDAAGLTPGEAAEVVALIKPRAVSIIGCYNHSIWRNRQEYIRPAPIIEDEFYWAVSWLMPEIKCIFAKPGHKYGLHDESLAGLVDTFIA